MKTNPLFAGVEEGVRLDLFAHSLGFESKVVTLGHEDLSEDDAAEYENDAGAWLDKWQPEEPRGFFPAGAFDTEDGPFALFIRPVTAFGWKLWFLSCAESAPKPESTKEAGIYSKFLVMRNDGRDLPGGDREESCYFVLDLAHDRHAAPAALAYARSCAGEYPKLSEEIKAEVAFQTGEEV